MALATPLALLGCGVGSSNNDRHFVAANGAGAASAAARDANAPAPAAGVTRDFLIGSWATDSCEVPSAVYAADGTTDGGPRRWTLESDRLIVTGGPVREQSVVERLGDDRMWLNTRDGPFELRRCPAGR